MIQKSEVLFVVFKVALNIENRTQQGEAEVEGQKSLCPARNEGNQGRADETYEQGHQ